MKNRTLIDRRRFLLGAVQAAGLLLLTGCDSLSRSEWFPRLLGRAEGLTRRAQRLVTTRRAMAKEYTEADLSPVFPSNGTRNPNDPDYQVLAQKNFADWKLEIRGLVESRPVSRSQNFGSFHRARRLRDTIASKDGAQSGNGKASRWASS